MPDKRTQFILNKFTAEQKQKRTVILCSNCCESSEGPGDLWPEYRDPVLLADTSRKMCESRSYHNLEDVTHLCGFTLVPWTVMK